MEKLQRPHARRFQLPIYGIYGTEEGGAMNRGRAAGGSRAGVLDSTTTRLPGPTTRLPGHNIARKAQQEE